jgi:hypothetical protein
MMKDLIIIGTIHSMVTGDQDRNESEYARRTRPSQRRSATPPLPAYQTKIEMTTVARR